MQSNLKSIQDYSCPLPLSNHQKIVLGHGSGGRLTHDLIMKIFNPLFSNPALNESNDAAILSINNEICLAFCTDSHVVYPLFFAGGDIGKLAICGTVNDLVVMGAQPMYISTGFIIEEGVDINIIKSIATSMQIAAEEAGVKIVAGDTKVVQKGKADGIYINTAGIGLLQPELKIKGSNAQVGDAIIISGTIGDHGVAVLEARGELGFSSGIKSDISPLNELVNNILDVNRKYDYHIIHAMRDPTRGGLATTLNEIACQSEVCIKIDENIIPIVKEVKSACELLGFDPLYMANEGKIIVVVDQKHSIEVLHAMRRHKYGTLSEIIGYVHAEPKGRVLLKTAIGSTRILDMLSGEMLPRIC